MCEILETQWPEFCSPLLEAKLVQNALSALDKAIEAKNKRLREQFEDKADDMSKLTAHIKGVQHGCETCAHKDDTCHRGYADCEEWESMSVVQRIFELEAELAEAKTLQEQDNGS